MRRVTYRVTSLAVAALVALSFTIGASATTVTTWDGTNAYTNCGTDVLTVPGPNTYGPCSFSRYNGMMTGGATTAAAAATGHFEASASANSTMPIGLTLNPASVMAEPQATARVTKKVAVAGAGNVVVNFGNISTSQSQGFSRIGGIVNYPVYTQSAYRGVKLEAIYRFHNCAITVNCAAGPARVVTNYSLPWGAVGSSTLTFSGTNAVPGAGWIEIEMGGYAIAQVAGPASASASISGDVTSLVVP